MTLTNGTKAIVRNIPLNIPAKIPAKFSCHGSVPIARSMAPIIISLNRATWGLCRCCQCDSINSTISDAITPDSDARGPTCKKFKIKKQFRKFEERFLVRIYMYM